ncbi:MAG: chorismate synthase [Prevotella sp.]|nr:chorismate synthase [Bacteroides sp.]MCM1367031.1 chorismate synthase [Prevotella sp.]MCM1437509.1 chorismate synthase [Prevotella sp.]
MNTIGKNLRLTTFGESHGTAIGGIIDGFPAQFPLDLDAVQALLDARRPGVSCLTTPRNEADKVEFLSGISAEGLTLGTSIGFIIRNLNHHSSDYYHLRDVFRPNHADYTYTAKYGIRDHRGGGRASARETANWCVAGAMALQLLEAKGICVSSRLIAVGEQTDPALFEREIENARNRHDSVGGLVECTISGIPAGLGSPVFDKLDAALAHAMLTVNGVKGFELGDGFEAARKLGSQELDTPKSLLDGRLICEANHSGGIQGGISNGMPIVFRVPFKPTPTIGQEVQTINSSGEKVLIEAGGRHDPCIALRGVHVVKALAAFVIADFLIAPDSRYESMV